MRFQSKLNGQSPPSFDWNLRQVLIGIKFDWNQISTIFGQSPPWGRGETRPPPFIRNSSATKIIAFVDLKSTNKSGLYRII